MLTPEPGVHLRMVLLGISAKSRLPLTQIGPSAHLNPSATRSSIAPFGIILSMAGSRRSNLMGAESRMPAALLAASRAEGRSETLNMVMARPARSREHIPAFIPCLLIEIDGRLVSFRPIHQY